MVEQVHHLREQRRGRDGETRVLHVVRVSRVAIAQLARKIGAEEQEQMLTDDGEHLSWDEVFEARPAVVFVRAALGILPCREDSPFHRLLESIGLVLLQLVQVIESADKKQLRDLFDHLQRIRNAAGPEGAPNAIDLILDVTGDHGLPCERLLVHLLLPLE